MGLGIFRRQPDCGCALIIVGVMTGLGVYIVRYTQQTYLHDLEGHLFDEAGLIADTVRPSFIAGPDPQIFDPLAKHW